MKILILSGSPRKNGNSDQLCEEVLRGALEKGHDAEKIRVAEKKIAPCLACDFCKNHGGRCALIDDMAEILDKFVACDCLVLASPVYFYSICAQLKAVIDRSVARWTEIKNKTLYYITTAAEDEPRTPEGTLACFRGFADCIEGSTVAGVLVAGGVYEKGDVSKRDDLLQKAYDMGKSM